MAAARWADSGWGLGEVTAGRGAGEACRVEGASGVNGVMEAQSPKTLNIESRVLLCHHVSPDPVQRLDPRAGKPLGWQCRPPHTSRCQILCQFC